MVQRFLRWLRKDAPFSPREPIKVPDDARYVFTRRGPVLVVPAKSDVQIMPVQTSAGTPVVPNWCTDPYDIEPAFRVRYEPVLVAGNMINIKAIKKNVHMVKLQAREIVVDPKRVMRRHWHKYLVEQRAKRIISDSRLFYP